MRLRATAGRRRTTSVMALGLGLASVALLLPAARFDQASAATRVARAAATQVAPAAATAVLDPGLDSCLRVAHADPGGVLVLVDGRMSAYQVGRLLAALRRVGRPACSHRVPGQTASTAWAWWTRMPDARRPGTVVLAVRGTPAQVALWRAAPPRHRLLGTADSGVLARDRVTGWSTGATGSAAAHAVLVRLGELMLDVHAWAGTRPQLLITSPAAQCAAAAASPRGVLVMGDSITSQDVRGMNAALIARGYVPCIYAQSSSRVYEHLARLVSGHVPIAPNVMVLLGNNDIFTGTGGYPFRFRAQALAMVRALRGHTLVWPTVWRTRKQSFLPPLQHNCAVVNTIVRDLARDFPTMRVPDWAAVVRAHPYLQFDGIHLTTEGLALRYRMLAAVLDTLVTPT